MNMNDEIRMPNGLAEDQGSGVRNLGSGHGANKLQASNLQNPEKFQSPIIKKHPEATVGPCRALLDHKIFNKVETIPANTLSGKNLPSGPSYPTESD
jgi:hypothetical protein